MPKTAVHQHNLPMSWQHDVGLTRKIASMEPESVAHLVEDRANCALGLSILAVYSAHESRSFCGGDRVHYEFLPLEAGDPKSPRAGPSELHINTVRLDITRKYHGRDGPPSRAWI